MTPVRWAEIAVANGACAHAGVQLIPVTGSPRFINEPQPGVYDSPPYEGSLPPELVQPLAAVLARHTTTPRLCWFAFWNGFGGTCADVPKAPTFHVPARDYHLLSGAIDAIGETAVDGRDQSANLWWPDDHTWCVATEIDLNTTYVGCDNACGEELLVTAELEASQIDPATGINWRSDPVKPWPGE